MSYGASTAPNWYFDTTTWANGSYTFTFSALDTSGRTSNTVTQSLTVANQSPVVGFTSPAASSTVAGKFTLKGTAAASSEGTASIYKICLKINGKTPTVGSLEGTSLSNYSDENSCMSYGASTAPNWYFDTTNWTNGTYTFTFSALDTSGRESNEVSRVLTVRN
jgi:hypothetical protein